MLGVSGIMLIFAGIIIIVLAFLLSILRGMQNTKVKSGGAVLIGPFPIVWGTDKETLRLAILLCLIAFLVLFFLLVILQFISIVGAIRLW